MLALNSRIPVSSITMPFHRKKVSTLTPLALVLAFSLANEGNVLAADNSALTEKRFGQSLSSYANTSSNDRYAMTRAELEVLAEINLMRSDPPGYALRRLAPLRQEYQGKLFYHPDRNAIPIVTNEGVAALDECINVLKYAQPAPLLSPSDGLALASRELAREQGATENTGHIGNYGSTMSERIERYGAWNGTIAENISYGFREPRDIVAQLLIDDGVSSRGHRKNLLDPAFRYVGVSIGSHRRYRDMCVMDFAGGYITRQP